MNATPLTKKSRRKVTYRKALVVAPQRLQEMVEQLCEVHSTSRIAKMGGFSSTSLRAVRDGIPMMPRSLEKVTSGLAHLTSGAAAAAERADELLTLAAKWATEWRDSGADPDGALELFTLIALAEQQIARAEAVLPAPGLRKRAAWLSAQVQDISSSRAA